MLRASMAPRVTYRLSFPDLHAHLVDVEARFDDVSGPVDLRMAAWTPGSYLIREYSRHVQDLSVTDGSGAPLAATKTDKATWRVDAGAARAIVARYRVYGWDLSVRTNHIDATHAFLNGAPTYLWIDPASPATVELDAPPGWTFTTALAGGPTRFEARDLDELIDSPILGFGDAGRVHELTAGGRPATFAVLGRADAGVANLDQLVADTTKIVDGYALLFGGVPYERYAFLLMLYPDAYGGLEHKSSCALLSSPFAFATRKKYEELLELVSHEYFHLWNVKRIRPRQLGPFDYTRENHTRALWVAEGLTSYYDRWMLRRTRLQSTKRYLEKLCDEWAKLLGIPGRFKQSIEESSFDAWIKLYRPDENSVNSTVSYYLKGGLVCLAMDLEIRRRSEGKKNLDHVLRHLWSKHEEGFDDLGVQREFEEAVGLDLGDFFDRHVRGREDPDLAGALRGVGLELRVKQDRDGDEKSGAWLGVTTRNEHGQLLVTGTLSGGPGEAAGLYAGDEVVAIDGWRAEEKGLGERISARKPGDLVRLTVFRRDELRDVMVTLGTKPRDQFEIVQRQDASDAEKALLVGWLGDDIGKL